MYHSFLFFAPIFGFEFTNIMLTGCEKLLKAGNSSYILLTTAPFRYEGGYLLYSYNCSNFLTGPRKGTQKMDAFSIVIKLFRYGDNRSLIFLVNEILDFL